MSQRYRHGRKTSRHVVEELLDRITPSMVHSPGALNKVGMMLLSGPDAIYYRDPDRRLYVEGAISMRWASAQHEQFESVKIYCDGNGDEAEGFLRPMVRFASWDRAKAWSEPQSALSSVVVDLAALPFDSLELEAAVACLQAEVDSPLLSEHGLKTKREFGVFPGVALGHLDVTVISSHQEVSRSLWVSEAPRLYNAVMNLKVTLRSLSTPLDRTNWLESYDWSPDQMIGKAGWEWDGSPL